MSGRAGGGWRSQRDSHADTELEKAATAACTQKCGALPIFGAGQSAETGALRQYESTTQSPEDWCTPHARCTTPPATHQTK
jgi:hypothetical protein